MIVATAGHVDHGKTSLVRALTGVDTDRLEEEKRRGLSIDLGFAYADLGAGEPIGFVDVPGHERFVRNMLAGVAAIDFALLVIAADDGPMPQTFEHLAILQLLGVERAAVVLTKIDRVDTARIAQVRNQIRALLAASPFRDASILEVASPAGHGIAAVRDCLAEAARELGTRAVEGHFRLSVDRVFSLAGTGLIVTGAVCAGRCAVGDRMVASPHGAEVRIRGIHANSRASQTAAAGQRCALNLAGTALRSTDIARGDWIVEAALHAPTRRIDARLDLLTTEPRALADGAMLQLHLAASTVRARVAVLGAKSVPPGQSALVQLVLERPIPALRTDRFVLRDQAAQRTVGGGSVVDPFAPARGRARPARLAELRAMQVATPAEALLELLAVRQGGVDLQSFERAWNLDQAGRQRLRAAVDLVGIDTETGPVAVSSAQWHALRAQQLSQLARYHQAHGDHVGMRARNGDPVSGAALRSLIDEGSVVRDGLHLRLPAHRARLSDAHDRVWRKVEAILLRSGLRPPIVGELARELDTDLPALLGVLRLASELGFVEPVAGNRFFLPQTIAALVDVARELARQSPDNSFDAASYRDRSGIGRNLTIQVLEYLDRNGFTRFARERRWIVDRHSARL